MSLVVLVLGKLGVPLGGKIDELAHRALSAIDFNQTLMTGMLSFLLFAGALHVDLMRLAEQRWPVAFMAFVGVLLSTVLVGLGMLYVLDYLGHPIPLVWSFVFGAPFGLALGYGVFRMLRTVDNYEVEVLLTVALVMGGYALAIALHVSGPIAIVVAGLLIGNHGRRLAMSTTTREHIDSFWELVDSILNAVLFVLIGFEMLLLPLDGSLLLPALAAIPIVLLARFLSVLLPAWLPWLGRWFDGHAVKVLTWGGLRGGISVALGLSLPATPFRAGIIAMAYACVLFSIVVQGLTLGRVLRSGTAVR